MQLIVVMLCLLPLPQLIGMIKLRHFNNLNIICNTSCSWSCHYRPNNPCTSLVKLKNICTKTRGFLLWQNHQQTTYNNINKYNNKYRQWIVDAVLVCQLRMVRTVLQWKRKFASSTVAAVLETKIPFLATVTRNLSHLTTRSILISFCLLPVLSEIQTFPDITN